MSTKEPNNKRPKIIGLVGMPAAGKDTAADYLRQRYGAVTVGFSDSLRDVLRRFDLPVDRDHLIKLSEALRATFGDDLLARAVAADLASRPASLKVVDGIRRPADLSILEKLNGFVLVSIEAAPEVRYQRLILRNENTDDRHKTYRQFLADQERSTEKSIQEILPKAEILLDNNGDLVALHRQLDKLMRPT